MEEIQTCFPHDPFHGTYDTRCEMGHASSKIKDVRPAGFTINNIGVVHRMIKEEFTSLDQMQGINIDPYGTGLMASSANKAFHGNISLHFLFADIPDEINCLSIFYISGRAHLTNVNTYSASGT